MGVAPGGGTEGAQCFVDFAGTRSESPEAACRSRDSLENFHPA
jgi:hypothetical protein